MKKILAKDSGETLFEHSKKVEEHTLISKARHIDADGTKDYGFLTTENLTLAALFHDIGKCTTYFQNRFKLHGEKNEYLKDDSKVRNKIPHRHSEVSYAFLKAYTTIPHQALKMIYWHHSISKNNYQINIVDILKCVPEKDIETMCEYVRSIDPTLLKERPHRAGITPSFFTEAENNNPEDSEFICGLSCLIMGDRIASGMPDNDDMMLNKQTKSVLYINPYAGSERSNTQEMISSLTDKTFIVNAPTGFGKTSIALQWAVNNPRKTLVVGPMNNITNSIYRNLNSEIKDSKSNLTNSLVLANEVNSFYNTSVKPEMVGTDITTINIDSFLTGSFKYEGVWLLLNLLHSDVIFDEYHMLFTESRIPAIFVRIMRARLWYTKAKTMFLSATPIDMSFYIDQDINIPIYPGKNKNYDQIHDIPYEVSFKDSIDTSFVPEDTMIIYNAISDVQEHALDAKFDMVSHSAFLDDDKQDGLTSIYLDYGKDNDPLKPKKGVLGTSVLRTSLNVSFNEITERLQSPIATLQTIGRCNRFKERTNPKFNIAKFYTKPNQSTVETMYDEDLSDLWYKALYKAFNDKKIMTLQELYDEYHKFNEKYSLELDDYYFSILMNSEKGIERIFPKMPYSGEKIENGIIVAGSNVLRSSEVTNEIFIVCFNEKGEYITTPINKQFHYKKKDVPEYTWFGFKTENEFMKAQRDYLVEVTKKGFTEFDFSHVALNKFKKENKPTFKTYLFHANKSCSPIFATEFIYSKRYGLIKKKLFNKYI